MIGLSKEFEDVKNASKFDFKVEKNVIQQFLLFICWNYFDIIKQFIFF